MTIRNGSSIKEPVIKHVMSNQSKILVYGYGNPGRQDDGLGKLLIDKAEAWVKKQAMSHIALDINYQLQVEDVTEMQDKELIIFADASMDERVNNYLFTPVYADDSITFSMHAVAPGYLLSLCNQMYGEHPPAYLLHIRGYKWDINEPVCPEALNNLDQAWEALKRILKNPGRLFEEEDPLHCSI